MWMNEPGEPGERGPESAAACRSRRPPARARWSRASPCRGSGTAGAARPRSARCDVARGVPALLHRGRRDAGHRLAVLLERGQVADHEDLRDGRAARGRASTCTRPARSSGTPSVARQRRGAHARRPEHRARRDAARRRSRRPSASMPVTARPVRTSTPSALELPLRAAPTSSSAIGRQDARARPRPGRHARVARVDAAEVAREGVARDLGQRAGELDAGRAAADDDEGEPVAGARSASSSRSAASKASSTRRADLERVLERLEAGRVRRPLVVAEVGVRRARRRRSGSRRPARRRSRRTQRAGEVDAGHLGQQHASRSAAGAGCGGSAPRCRSGDRPAVATW